MARKISKSTWRLFLNLKRNDAAGAASVYKLIAKELGAVPADVAHQLLMLQDDSGKALRKLLPA